MVLLFFVFGFTTVVIIRHKWHLDNLTYDDDNDDDEDGDEDDDHDDGDDDDDDVMMMRQGYTSNPLIGARLHDKFCA